MSEEWMDGLRGDVPAADEWETDEHDYADAQVVALHDNHVAADETTPVAPEVQDAQPPHRVIAGLPDPTVKERSTPVRPSPPPHVLRPRGAPNLVADTVKPAPKSGWRKAVYLGSLRTINAGESPSDVRQRQIAARLCAPVHGDHKIAIAGLKGGVAKSTVTVGLGHAFASARSDRVLAIDANPDAGVLAERINQFAAPGDSLPTIYDLLDHGQGQRYRDVRAHTLEAETGLQVLAAHDDPARSEALSEHDYRRAMALVQDHYQVLLSDCGTGITHPVMSGVLEVTDSLIAPTKLDVSAVKRTNAMLDWMDAHHYGHLVDRAIVVVSHMSGRGKPPLSPEQVTEYFGDRVRAVVCVPFDRHLDEGAQIHWDRLQPATRAAYRTLAQHVAEDFTLGLHAPRPTGRA